MTAVKEQDPVVLETGPGRVIISRGDADEALRCLFLAMTACGLWADAVCLALSDGGLDAADIAREAGVPLPIVIAWSRGLGFPSPVTAPRMAARIAVALRLRSFGSEPGCVAPASVH